MSKIIKYILLPLFIICFLAYAALTWKLSNIVLTTRPSNLELSKSRMVTNWNTTYDAIMEKFPAPKDFSITTKDGVHLKAWHLERPDTANCAAILVHGFTATKEGALKYANIYWDCGCDLFLYDQRGHGESDDAYPTGGIKESEDLIEVTQWVKQNTRFQAHQIAWVGSSWGAAAALQAGVSDEEVAFIVADSPFQDWYSAIFERAVRMYGDGVEWVGPSVMALVGFRAGIATEEASVLKAAPHVKIPVLLIHSKTDAQTASSQSVNIAEQLPKDYSVFHHTDWGSRHTLDVVARPNDYAELVRDFVHQFDLTFGDCK